MIKSLGQNSEMPEKFPYTESELLKIASRFNKNLKTHFTDLQGYSAELDSDFLFRFKAAYFKSRIRPAGLEVDLFAQKMHEELNSLINDVQIVFQDFRYYIQKAFPHDSRMWEAYGYCEVEHATHDYEELLHCLDDFIKLIRTKKYDLLAVRCPQKNFKEIEELYSKIQDKRREILDWDNKKSTLHEARMNSLNKLYKLMRVVHKAAAARLKDDPEIMEKLTLPVTEKK